MTTMENDLLTRCHDAWLALEPFRRERLRCKRLSYGTDGASANNLVRQLLKSVVGRYRYLRVGSTVDLDADVRAELDLDARTLEEFLISGMAVNRRRLDPHHGRHEFANVSPERIFFTRCSEPDASDATLVGMLHDFSATQLLRQFGDDDPALCRDLMEHYRGRLRGQGGQQGIQAHEVTHHTPYTQPPQRMTPLRRLVFCAWGCGGGRRKNGSSRNPGAFQGGSINWAHNVEYGGSWSILAAIWSFSSGASVV